MVYFIQMIRMVTGKVSYFYNLVFKWINPLICCEKTTEFLLYEHSQICNIQIDVTQNYANLFLCKRS